jgi:hypothetical protein
MSRKGHQQELTRPRAPQSPPDDHRVPDSPPVREEYPGPQETSTGERLDPGSSEARPDSQGERRGRRRGAS